MENILTRFRTINHLLAIETGRWNKSPINEIKCNFCLELEDEFHFFIGMQIVHYYKKTHFTKVLLEQAKHVKIF